MNLCLSVDKESGARNHFFGKRVVLMKRNLVLIFIILALLVSGCEKNVPAGDIGKITDTQELEALWQGYLYDSVGTISISDFNSPGEIDPRWVAEYCWIKYFREKGTTGLQEKDKKWLFPREEMLKYATRYFGLTEMDLSGMEKDLFDPQSESFLMEDVAEKNPPAHTEENPWEIGLGKVTRNEDGTISAELEHFASLESDLIDWVATYTLREQQDGSLSFVSYHKKWINNHLVSITGNCDRYDRISGCDDEFWKSGYTFMLGETGSKVILLGRENQKDCLILLDPDTMKAVKKLEMEESAGPEDYHVVGNKIVQCLDDKMVVLGKNLKLEKTIPLPKEIKSKIKRGENLNNADAGYVLFGGYDISRDFKKLVYSDEEGVKMLHLADNNETLLSKTYSKDSETLFHWFPRFVDDDRQVITSRGSFEVVGIAVCDLETGVSREVPQGNYSTKSLFFDTGLLDYTNYFDFHTGKTTTIDLPVENNFEIPDSCVGENFAAMVIEEYQNNTLYVIHRLDLKTLQVEPGVIAFNDIESSTHLDVKILGVLADGRIIFSYELYPSESGICITRN